MEEDKEAADTQDGNSDDVQDHKTWIVAMIAESHTHINTYDKTTTVQVARISL